MLNKNQTKALKFFHLIFASCWLGGILSITIVTNDNSIVSREGMLIGINTAGKLIDKFLVITGAMGCLITGILYSILTPWGFFKHKWIIFKWIITICCVMIGIFFLGVWKEELFVLSYNLGNAALNDTTYLMIQSKRLVLVLLQISALLFIFAISIIKPWNKK